MNLFGENLCLQSFSSLRGVLADMVFDFVTERDLIPMEVECNHSIAVWDQSAIKFKNRRTVTCTGSENSGTKSKE
jgi:hypothetical protein